MEENKRNKQENEQSTSINKDQRGRVGQGDYKNIETAVNNPSYFDDDYAAKQEDEITEQEHKTQKEGRVGRS